MRLEPKLQCLPTSLAPNSSTALASGWLIGGTWIFAGWHKRRCKKPRYTWRSTPRGEE